MIGTIKKKEDKFIVEYKNVEGIKVQLPLYPKDVEHYESIGQKLDDTIPVYTIFFMVDEFTHPELFTNTGWGDGETFAKVVI